MTDEKGYKFVISHIKVALQGFHGIVRKENDAYFAPLSSYGYFLSLKIQIPAIETSKFRDSHACGKKKAKNGLIALSVLGGGIWSG